jgi:monoamine oxidase
MLLQGLHYSIMLYDIVIVGAGIAGLHSALEAKRINKNLRILILEKYNKEGGRLDTIHTTVNHRKIQFEAGAGRISEKHTATLKLIKRYGLHAHKISDETGWRKYGTSETMPNNFNELWTDLCAQFDQLPAEIKRKKTMRDLAIEVLGVDIAKQLLETYGYRAEMEVFNAEAAIDLFKSINGGFLYLVEGFSELVRKMVADLKKQGVEIKHNVAVSRVDVSGHYKITAVTKLNRYHTYEAKRVILAVHRNALEKIYPFSPEHPLMKATVMEPLLRIYSVYKDASWFPKTKVVTDSALRYIIPINQDKGLIMSSYLDARDIELWRGLWLKSRHEDLINKIHNETCALFPEKDIKEKPIYISPQFWADGCTYWLQDVDYKKVSEHALQPYPITHPKLHIVGESFSTKQQWTEGALEHADSLIALIGNELKEQKEEKSKT